MLQVQQRNCRMYFCGGDDDEAVEVKLKFALVKDKPWQAPSATAS